MSKLWAICRNTLIETIRQPIYGWLVMAAIFILAATLPLSHFTLESNWQESDEKMLQNLGLSTLLISGLLIAVFSASGALSREIDDGTALTVMVKPLSRTTFVVGKFLGLAAAMVLAYAIMTLVFLLTVRHGVVSAATEAIDWPVIVLGTAAVLGTMLFAALGNYSFRWSFWPTWMLTTAGALALVMLIVCFVGKEWTIVPFGYDLDVQAHRTITKIPAISGQLLLAIALIFMAVVLLTAVAVAAGTRLGTTLTLTVVLATFVIGSMHPFFFLQQARAFPAMRYVGWLVPDLTLYYQLDALTMGTTIPGSYVAVAAAHCLLYVCGALAVGAGLFQTRQLESLASAKSMPALVGLISGLGRIGGILTMLAAAVLALTPPFWTVPGAGVVLGVLVAGAAGLFYWTRFASGRRWTWWLGFVITVLNILGSATLWVTAAFWPDVAGQRTELEGVLALLIGGLWLGFLMLPATRRHFRS